MNDSQPDLSTKFDQLAQRFQPDGDDELLFILATKPLGDHGEPADRYGLQIQNRQCQLLTGEALANSAKQADCEISAPIEIWQQLLSGDLNPAMAFMTGQLKVAGDLSKATKLAKMFQY